MKEKPKISVQDLHLYYGENHALKGISMDIRKNAVTAFIGPSGCGKSTFLKTMNRMNDLVDGVKIEGKILLDGKIFTRRMWIRRSSGKEWEWCFSSPIRFP